MYRVGGHVEQRAPVPVAVEFDVGRRVFDPHGSCALWSSSGSSYRRRRKLISEMPAAIRQTAPLIMKALVTPISSEM